MILPLIKLLSMNSRLEYEGTEKHLVDDEFSCEISRCLLVLRNIIRMEQLRNMFHHKHGSVSEDT